MSYQCTKKAIKADSEQGERGRRTRHKSNHLKLLKAWFAGMMKNLNFILTAVKDTHERCFLMITLGHSIKTQTVEGQECRQGETICHQTS